MHRNHLGNLIKIEVGIQRDISNKVPGVLKADPALCWSANWSLPVTGRNIESKV